MLALTSGHPEQSTATGENRLAPGFWVSDLDETLRRLRSAGVRIDADIDGADEGYRLGRIWDPEARVNVTTTLDHPGVPATANHLAQNSSTGPVMFLDGPVLPRPSPISAPNGIITTG